MTVIPIIIGALGTVPEETGRKGNRGMNWDHPNYCIVEVGQNTEKSSGDSRRHAVTQTPVKDHQLMLV